MFYAKNLPTWERIVRVVGAALMALCAWHFRSGPAGIIFGVSAAVTVLTGLVGFCPMCALAGRRLDAKTKARP
jgi:hypothetical protein